MLLLAELCLRCSERRVCEFELAELRVSRADFSLRGSKAAALLAASAVAATVGLPAIENRLVNQGIAFYVASLTICRFRVLRCST